MVLKPAFDRRGCLLVLAALGSNDEAPLALRSANRLRLSTTIPQGVRLGPRLGNQHVSIQNIWNLTINNLFFQELQ